MKIPYDRQLEMEALPLFSLNQSLTSHVAKRGSEEVDFRILARHRVIQLCIGIIVLVASYDMFLTVKYAASLNIYERNPVGRAIMQLNYGEVHSLEPVAFFTSCKFLGTIIVVMILHGLAQFRQEWGLVVAIALALFQLFLLTQFLL